MMPFRFARRSARPLSLLMLAALIATGCSDTETPTNPSGIPNAAGIWNGNYRIRNCTGSAVGVPPTLCATLTDPASPLQPVRITVTQTEDRLSGTMELSGWYVRSIPVTGTVDRGGNVTLGGTATFPETGCPAATSRLTLTGWSVILNRDVDAMTQGTLGLVASVRQSPTSCVLGEVTLLADTLQLTRIAAPAPGPVLP